MAQLPRRALAAERAQGRRRQGHTRSRASRYHQRLAAGGQDYVVAPPQPWLDGINAGDGFIKQFVAMPLGQGYTVEGQVTGEETHGGLQLVVFDPKPGRFPDEAPHVDGMRARRAGVDGARVRARGGGARRWGWPRVGGCGSSSTRTRTGWTRGTRRTSAACTCTSPTARLDADHRRAAAADAGRRRAYVAAGLPWFDLYDDHLGDIGASGVLAGVKSVGELDAQHVADGVW